MRAARGGYCQLCLVMSAAVLVGYVLLLPGDYRAAAWSDARRADTARADQAHALFAEAADVFRALARGNVRNAVAVRAGEGVELDRGAVRMVDARVAAGMEHAIISVAAQRAL